MADAAVSRGSPPQWEATTKVSDDDLKKAGTALHTVTCAGDSLLTGSSRPVVKVWQVAEGKLKESGKLKLEAVGCSCVAAHSDGNSVAVCSADGAISLWDIREPSSKKASLDAEIPKAWKVTFLDDAHLISGGTSGDICVWDLRMQRLQRELSAESTLQGEDLDSKRRKLDTGRKGKKHKSPIYSLAVSSDCNLLGVGRASGAVSVFRKLELMGSIDAHIGEEVVPVRAVCFDSGSKLLLSGGDDHHVCLLDAAGWGQHQGLGRGSKRPQVERFSAHKSWVTAVRACPDPLRPVLVSTGWDKQVKLWDYRTHELLQSFSQHTDCVLDAAFAPSNGRYFVTVGADATIALYTAKSEATPGEAGPT
eukprot:TRINITY_DN58129_c0_g1_i1.p1 TRINITY_DN58129_c0_g1~~TRINITY_DN58129_c0_g1_i1.p1  ORF type:complete len:364 (-),score=72.15 TRINITY_DN58129_c0_g1_i1:27-1118(-)